MGALLVAMVLSQAAGWNVQPLVAGVAPPPLPVAGTIAVEPLGPPGQPGPPIDERWNGYPGSASAGGEPQPFTPTAGESGASPARAEDVGGGQAPAVTSERDENWLLPLASSVDVPAAAPAAGPRAAEAPVVPVPEPAPEPARITAQAGCDGYQGACWGSSQQQVGGLFPGCVNEGPEQMSLKSEVAGESSETRFLFVDDQLVAVSITFVAAPSRPARYLALYANVRDGLATKYGPLAAEKEEWYGEHFKAMERGQALVLGGLRLSSTWQAGATAIALSCAGSELKGRVQINYASLALAPLLQRQAERRQLQGL